MQAKKLTLQRLMKEEASLERQPLPNAIVIRKGLLNFHFCLYNLEGPYKGGFYHGVLELHENYPFAAPKLIFYTPSGRFDTNIPICTSFTNYHQETWTSAWNVRTLILATISFMYSEEPSYGCRQDPHEQRVRLAQDSLRVNMASREFVQLFEQKILALGLVQKERFMELNKQQPQQKNYVAYVQEEDDDEEEKNPDEQNNGRVDWRKLTKRIGLIIIVSGLVIFVVSKIS